MQILVKRVFMQNKIKEKNLALNLDMLNIKKIKN